MNTDVAALVKCPKILACILCQQRKIKCDKGAPCSNCEKVGAVCTPSTPAPVRKKRRTNRDLRERLARCEALLKQYAPPAAPGEFDTSTSSPSLDYAASVDDSFQSPAPFASLVASDAADANCFWMPTGKVIVEDGGFKYVDNFPWVTVQKQIASMRQLLEDEERSVCDSEVTPPREEEVNLSFSADSPSNLEDLAPAPVQVFKLWQVFVDRVNPLTKLLHVPSFQPLVFEASTDHAKIPHNAQSLLYAIYMVSTVALTEVEAIQMLGMPKEDALKRFSAGLKAALTRANFLEKYDMMTLQAMVLYLLAIHSRANRHETWILSGILIRMAQKLGLHRDGETLNFTPFEAEMRRRLWWQILMSDTKHAIASGFHAPMLTWHWDTRLPHNVNDADLYPNFPGDIQPRDGPTEMAFFLVLCELFRFVVENRIHDLATLGLGGADSGKMAKGVNGVSSSGCKGTPMACATPKDVAQLLDAKLLEIEDRYVDPSVSPLHKVASRFRNVLTGELLSLLTPLHELPEWGTEIFHAEDNVFRICLIHFERHLDLYEEIEDTSFVWFFKLHFEPDGILFIASQLQERSLGTLVDRSWTLIDRVYKHHPELWDMTRKRNVTLGSSILRAWRGRERGLAQLGLPYDVPSVVSGLKSTVPQSNPSPAPVIEAMAKPDPDWLIDQLSGYSLDPTGLDGTLDPASFVQNGHHF